MCSVIIHVTHLCQNSLFYYFLTQSQRTLKIKTESNLSAAIIV